MVDEKLPERLAVVETKVENLNSKLDDVNKKLDDISIFLRNRLIDEIHNEKNKQSTKIKQYGVYASLFMSSLSVVAILLVHLI